MILVIEVLVDVEEQVGSLVDGGNILPVEIWQARRSKLIVSKGSG